MTAQKPRLLNADGKPVKELTGRGKRAGALTQFHVAFINEYAISKNYGDAYSKAGGTGKHPDKAGWAMAQLPQVKAAIEELLDEQNALRILRAEAAGITEEYLTKQFVAILERSMQAVPILDNKGNETGEWQFDGANANRAAENLGKHIGYFPKEPPVILNQDNRTQVVNIGNLDADARRALSVLAKSLEGGPGSDSGAVVAGAVAQS